MQAKSEFPSLNISKLSSQDSASQLRFLATTSCLNFFSWYCRQANQPWKQRHPRCRFVKENGGTKPPSSVRLKTRRSKSMHACSASPLNTAFDALADWQPAPPRLYVVLTVLRLQSSAHTHQATTACQIQVTHLSFLKDQVTDLSFTEEMVDAALVSES